MLSRLYLHLAHIVTIIVTNCSRRSESGSVIDPATLKAPAGVELGWQRDIVKVPIVNP